TPQMNSNVKLEHRASSGRSKDEGESSLALCDGLSRTRDNSQRQLPTDHDYAVPTREYPTDQSSLKPALAAARSGLEKLHKQRQKQPHNFADIDKVTPYQGNVFIEMIGWISPAKWPNNRLSVKMKLHRCREADYTAE